MENRPDTLIDAGEDGILNEIIKPLLRSQCPAPESEIVVGLGDDAAVIALNDVEPCLVITTDPCPSPALCMIEPSERDLFHYGWMTVIINLSDLASMGATPLALVVSTVMPERLKKRAYERFMRGLVEAGAAWSCPILGGNIKDGPAFTATGTALGRVSRDNVLTRDGAKPGDVVVVIGEMGLFWAALLSKLRKVELDPADAEQARSALLKPKPRLREGVALAKAGVATSCMDSSDGVSTCLDELSRSSTDARELRGESPVGIEVNLEELTPSPSVKKLAEAVGINPGLLMLSWGGWELVCTVAPEDFGALAKAIEALPDGSQVSKIGKVVDTCSNAHLVSGRHRVRLSELDIGSKRFSQTSIFSHGLGPFVKRLQAVTERLSK